jgi:large subunit ribosomal protein L17
MNHGVRTKILGRKKGERTALMRSLIRSLIMHGAVETTAARAKAIQPRVEKLITRAKKGTLSDRRIILSRLYNDRVVTEKLIGTVAPSMKDRKGGYTRIVKLAKPMKDGRPVVHMSLV